MAIQVNVVDSTQGQPPQETQATSAVPVNEVDSTGAAGAAPESTQPVVQDTAGTETPTEGTYAEDTGTFCFGETCFDLTTEEGRARLIQFMANSGSDNKLLQEIQEYLKKHHPDRNITQILADEIINTILAGFFSGRLATGGAAPLTTEGSPPAVDIKVDENTAKYLASFVAGAVGHTAQIVDGVLTAFVEAISFGTLKKENGILAKQEGKGVLVEKDSWWGYLNAPGLRQFFGIKDNGDGTLSVGRETGAWKFGKFSGDVIALVVGPGKVKSAARGVSTKFLKRKPKPVREAIRAGLEQSYRQWKALKGSAPKIFSKQIIDNIATIDLTKRGLVTGAGAAGKAALYKTTSLASVFAPLAAEWIVAENLAKSFFDRYRAEISPEDRQAWATWFAFNYVWADFTIQIMDKVLGVAYSIRGQRKSDVRTIGGLALKVFLAEILTGAQIIAGISITKIQKGELTFEDLGQFITEFLNSVGEPVTLNEVLQALSGDTPGIEGKDFDVIKYDGQTYTIRPPSTIIDINGKKVPRGSALGNKIWAHWEANYGDQAVGEQVIEANKGGLIYRQGGGEVQPEKDFISATPEEIKKYEHLRRPQHEQLQDVISILNRTEYKVRESDNYSFSYDGKTKTIYIPSSKSDTTVAIAWEEITHALDGVVSMIEYSLSPQHRIREESRAKKKAIDQIPGGPTPEQLESMQVTMLRKYVSEIEKVMDATGMSEVDRMFPSIVKLYLGIAVDRIDSAVTPGTWESLKMKKPVINSLDDLERMKEDQAETFRSLINREGYTAYQSLGGFVKKPDLISRARDKAGMMQQIQQEPMIARSPMNNAIGSPTPQDLIARQ